VKYLLPVSQQWNGFLLFPMPYTNSKVAILMGGQADLIYLISGSIKAA